MVDTTNIVKFPSNRTVRWVSLIIAASFLVFAPLSATAPRPLFMPVEIGRAILVVGLLSFAFKNIYNYRGVKLLCVFFILAFAGPLLGMLAYWRGPRFFINQAPAMLIPLLGLLIPRWVARDHRSLVSLIWRLLISIAGFLIFVQLALLFGWMERFPYHAAEGRLAGIITFGPFSYVLWGNWLGAMSTMFIPAILVMLTTPVSTRQRKGLYLILALFVYHAIASATLGALSAAVFGCAGVLITVARLDRRVTKKSKLAVIGLLALIGIGAIQPYLPEGLRNKVAMFQIEGRYIGSIAYREMLMRETLEIVQNSPMGLGFGTRYEEDLRDESNFFVAYTTGGGLLGIIGIMGMLVILTVIFVKSLISSRAGTDYFFSGIGLSTIIAVSFGANSSDQILLSIATSILFWVMMGLCLYGTTYRFNNLNIISKSKGESDRGL